MESEKQRPIDVVLNMQMRREQYDASERKALSHEHYILNLTI